jgi:hypothetical protein
MIWLVITLWLLGGFLSVSDMEALKEESLSSKHKIITFIIWPLSVIVLILFKVACWFDDSGG